MKNSQKSVSKLNRREFALASTTALLFAAPVSQFAIACDKHDKMHQAKAEDAQDMKFETADNACSKAHAQLSSDLGRLVCDPATDPIEANRALSTANCPHCGTHLSADLSNYALHK